MLVRELLQSKQRSLVITRPTMTLVEAMDLLISNQISCLPVLNDGEELIGIVSDKDIFRAVFREPKTFREIRVDAIMSTNLIVGIPDDDVTYIAGLMTNNRIRHIPIVEDNRMVGLLSLGDIVKSQIANMQVENRYLWQYISGDYPC